MTEKALPVTGTISLPVSTAETPTTKPTLEPTTPKFRPETLELIKAAHGVLALTKPEVYGHEAWVMRDKHMHDVAIRRLEQALFALGFPVEIGADRESKPWREVLGTTWPDLPPFEYLALATFRYKTLWSMLHPMQNGKCTDLDRLTEIQIAIAQARKELG